MAYQLFLFVSFVSSARSSLRTYGCKINTECVVSLFLSFDQPAVSSSSAQSALYSEPTLRAEHIVVISL
jgi:hypothetical protein